MARSRSLRLWTVALWGLCLLAATGGHADGAHHHASAGVPAAAFGVVSPASDPAVLPARVADDLRVGTQLSPHRLLVLAAVLAALVGLPPVRRSVLAAPGRDPQPLRARRHSIALRAPPLQFA